MRGASSAVFAIVRRFAEALAAGLIVGLMLLILVPVVIGWRPYTVLTGSMRPVIQPGDVVMDRPQRASGLHVGDVVTFKDQTRKGRLVTHRIRSIAHGREFTVVETRGDANNTSERWQVASDDPVGVVVYTLPWIGHVSVLARTPLGLITLVVIPVLGIGFLALRSIWTDEDEPEQEAPPAEGDDDQLQPPHGLA